MLLFFAAATETIYTACTQWLNVFIDLIKFVNAIYFSSNQIYCDKEPMAQICSIIRRDEIMFSQLLCIF